MISYYADELFSLTTLQQDVFNVTLRKYYVLHYIFPLLNSVHTFVHLSACSFLFHFINSLVKKCLGSEHNSLYSRSLN